MIKYETVTCSMDIFPTLYTPRLILRKITIDDIPALLKYANNPKIAERIVNIPYPYEEPTAVFRISFVHQGFKKKIRYVFAIISKEAQELVGEISLHLDQRGAQAELGYWLGEPLWNQGIITEAIEGVVAFGFEKLQLEAIFASCDEDNLGSHRVLEKNSFERIENRGKQFVYQLSHKKIDN